MYSHSSYGHPLFRTLLLVCSTISATAALGSDMKGAQQEILRSAQLWQSKYRTDLARQHVEKLLLVEPNSPWGLATLASIALQENKTTEAKQIIEKLRAQNASPEVMLQLQRLLKLYEPQAQQELAQMRLFAQSGRAKEAALLAQKLFPEGPLALGGFALEYYRTIAAAPGVNPELEKALLSEYERTGDVQYQYIWIQRALERGAPSSSVLPLIEKLAFKAADDDKTIEDLWRWSLQKTAWEQIPEAAQKFLQRYPKNEAIKQMYAESLQRRETLQREASLPINIAKRAADQALRQNQLDIALQEAHKILRISANDADGWGFIGYVAVRQTQYQQAQEAFEKAHAFSKEPHWQRLAIAARINAHLQLAEQALQEQDSEKVRAIAKQILHIDGTNADGMMLLAKALQLEGDYQQAHTAYLEVLARHPQHLDAITELVRMLIAEKKWEAADQIMDKYSRSLPQEQPSVLSMRSEIFAAQSEALWEQGHRSAALRLQEQAVALMPQSPWLRYRLARIYIDMGEPEFARTVMNEGVNLHSSDSEMRYARALIAVAQKNWQQATDDLLAIPEQERISTMEQLRYESQLQMHIADAQSAENKDELEAALARGVALSLQAQNVQTQAQLAGIWTNAGYLQQALDIWESMAKSQNILSPSMQLSYAQTLQAHTPDASLLPELMHQLLVNQPALSREEQIQLLELYADHAQRIVTQHMTQGATRKAQAFARETLLPEVEQSQTKIARGRLLATAQDWQGALVLFTESLEQQPQDFMLMLDTANAYRQTGDLQSAYTLASQAKDVATAQQPWQQLALVRLWQRMNEPKQAKDLLDQVAGHPEADGNEVLLHRARIALDQEQYLHALDHFRTVVHSNQLNKETAAKLASVRQEYQAVEARKQSWVEMGVKRLSKSGNAGISALKGWEISHKAWTADKNLQGHYFFQADRLQLGASALPVQADGSFAGMAEYGQVAAYLASGYGLDRFKDFTSRHAQGLNVGVGFESERKAWDIGLIGINMPVTNLVGGISFDVLQTPKAKWRMSLGRRPVTGSVLSYIGAQDPATGKTWGGVVNNFASVRVANQQGVWDQSANLTVGLLTGKNVATNTRVQLRFSAGKDIWRSTHQRIYAGSTLQFQAHRKNLAEYSWGHGGYYSPKFGTTISFPVEWTGRAHAWTWLLQGGVSLSNTAKSRSALYPRSTDFANAFADPQQRGHYSTRGGTGTGWSVRAGLEHQVNANLAIGGQLGIDRSEDYAPNQLQLYMRFFLDPVRQLPQNQPRVVTPYSEY